MSDQPDEQPQENVAAALVRQLGADAELVDSGRFSLDYVRGREQLAKRRHSEPQAFVVLLVEAAHMLGATAVSFATTAPPVFGVHIDCEAPRRLDELFDGLVGGAAEREGQDQRLHMGRQRIALAIDAALALGRVSHVELLASYADAPAVGLRFDAAGVHVQTPGARTAPGLDLVVHGEAACFDDAAVLELLDRRFRHAKLALRVDTRTIEYEPFADVGEVVELRDHDARVIGRAGYSIARPEARLVFVAWGVVIEERVQDDLPPGFIAVMAAEDLRRDLSLAKLIHDEAYEQRCELARKQARAMQRPARIEIVQPNTVTAVSMERAVAVGAVTTVSLLPLGLVVLGEGLLLIPGLIAGVLAGVYLWRRRKLRGAAKRGEPGVAEILDAGQSTADVMNLLVSITIPDSTSWVTTMEVAATSAVRRKLIKGAYLPVRIDRRRPNEPLLASDA